MGSLNFFSHPCQTGPEIFEKNSKKFTHTVPTYMCSVPSRIPTHSYKTLIVHIFDSISVTSCAPASGYLEPRGSCVHLQEDSR